MTLDEAIKHCLEVADKSEIDVITYKNCKEVKTNMYEKLTAEKAENDCRECANDHRQLAAWLTELKDLREVNRVLINECDRLIKEKGELLNKVSGGDVLRICQLEEREKEYKRLLKAAVEDNKNVLTENFGDICQFCKHGSNPTAQCCKPHNGSGSWCCENAEWRYADEAERILKGE